MSSESRLHRYAIAAASVPLATMATTQSVVADIVYESVGQTIGGPGGSTAYLLEVGVGDFGNLLFLAANNPGTGSSFVFGVGGGSKTSSGGAEPNGIGLQVNIGGSKGSKIELRRFAAGDQIGYTSKTSSIAIGGASFGKGAKGPFADGGAGYIGLQIESDSLGGAEFHYGWIALDWNASTLELTIDGFAYETEAGVGIEAGAIPAPGALGLFGLAAGAAGIRRKRKA
ncbi:MAG: hypothetical protein CMJ54_05300 [Planctomycetaceae bacterium]|nr:hypothetical protein [Planctomycetaceae bacterium]